MTTISIRLEEEDMVRLTAIQNKNPPATNKSIAVRYALKITADNLIKNTLEETMTREELITDLIEIRNQTKYDPKIFMEIQKLLQKLSKSTIL